MRVMAEPASQLERVRPGTPLTVGSFTLLPVERVVLHSNRGDGGLWVLAYKEPRALIVRDANGIRAIGAGGVAVTLGALIEEVPGLDAALAAL